ncbi:Mss4-like protein [Apodospora peruviana]|uniref:Mss4-like protein n=1 Tax=Apodospora peruviana TaxID=516989 RepID=A0AAE0ITW5_9PEZI|nr:Mss4-like protein [Apodospora peruviana]
MATTISCLCGSSRQTVSLLSPNPWTNVSLCHCDTCRHTTGQLFVSYIGIASPSSLENLSVYSPSTSRRIYYFCATCGCHVFRRSADNPTWEVGTGVITHSPDLPSNNPPELGWHHEHVDATKDGGLSIWLGPPPPPPLTASDSDTLSASCHCQEVSFTITRPSPGISTAPKSGFSDLIHPFKTTPQSIVSNPQDIKWWLCHGNPPSKVDPDKFPTHYLSGTCACRSCRLISGFEIQSWAFIPRKNIFSPSLPNTPPKPLEFSQHPLRLKSYESSKGVLRDFCPTCGATVFWHDKWHRPDLIDVSVGLFKSPDGIRHKSWLAWFTDRVSFAEDVDLDRTGGCAEWAKRLVGELQVGMIGTET